MRCLLRFNNMYIYSVVNGTIAHCVFRILATRGTIEDGGLPVRIARQGGFLTWMPYCIIEDRVLFIYDDLED